MGSRLRGNDGGGRAGGALPFDRLRANDLGAMGMVSRPRLHGGRLFAGTTEWGAGTTEGLSSWVVG